MAYTHFGRMYRFARYSQDGNRSHFQKCLASREGGPPACLVMIRESTEHPSSYFQIRRSRWNRSDFPWCKQRGVQMLGKVVDQGSMVNGSLLTRR